MIIVIRPDFTLENINEAWLMYALIKVDTILEDFGVNTPATDYNDFLKYATIVFYLENAGKAGQIQSQFGDIKSRKSGKKESQYQTSAPMFFFSSGEAKQFYGLLGHETWRMEGYHILRSYIRLEFRKRTGKKYVYASYTSDDTLRGDGWDQENWLNATGQDYSQYNTRKW